MPKVCPHLMARPGAGQPQIKAVSHQGWTRGLRPLLWWLLLVLALLGYRKHREWLAQTRIEFSVTLGNSPAFNAMARLDGKQVVSGANIALGAHAFTVNHPKAGPFQTNFFAWYGRHDFGEIQLKRSLGTLRIQAAPLASAITVTGPEYSITLSDTAGTNLTVPTDSYIVRAEYPHWSQTQKPTVVASQTASCVFAPQLGALRLSCNKGEATYRLESDGQLLSEGDLPTIVAGLPAGGYKVTASYHGHPLQRAATVEADRTNDVAIEFVFGTARLETTPPGAEVRAANGSYLGQTPLVMQDMTPAMAQFNLSLPGYEPLSVTVDIAAGKTSVCHTNLISSRYVSAMREARGYLASAKYALAARAVGEALGARPDDAEALALQNEVNGRLAEERQRLERLTRPRRVFDGLCGHFQDAGLFATRELKTDKPAREVARAIVRALTNAPSAFQILQADSPEPDVYQVVAQQSSSLGILGGSERDCLVVVGQTKDDEVQIWFKVVEYRVKHTEVINGFSIQDRKQMIPIHPSRMQMTEDLQRRVREGVVLASEIIQTAIGK